jgi:pantoate--beta-alanine ligase
MGYLHAGHLDLMRRARATVGHQGKVVASIYINPTQFAPSEDLTKYPRNLSRDAELCRTVGVDVLFLPSDAEMYPGRCDGLYSTYVQEEVLSQGMEGVTRPTHFRGVTTVVAKLFNCVLPSVAIFGAKDFQQATVIRRMVSDLNFPIRIQVEPTFREQDGLAMSSRNAYLTSEQRQSAPCLYKVLRAARRTLRATGKGLRANPLRSRLIKEIQTVPSARVDYLEFFDPITLRPVSIVKTGHQVALAVWIGKTRLIDNVRL